MLLLPLLLLHKKSTCQGYKVSTHTPQYGAPGGAQTFSSHTFRKRLSTTTTPNTALCRQC